MTSPLHHPQATLRRYRGDYAAHAHAFVQVLCGVAGRLELEVDGRAHVVEPGCGLVVRGGAAHAYDAPRGARVVVIDTPDGPGLQRTRRFALPPIWRTGTADDIDAVAWLETIALAPRALPRRRLDVDAVVAAVEPALHERWTIARLAALVHHSVPRLHARWRELTGRTPQAWLRELRLDRAERLLAAGQPLETAALQVGYASASALAFALKRERGTSARALRQRR